MSGLLNSITGWSSILDDLVICSDASDETALIERLVRSTGPHVLSFANANALNLAWKDQTFFRLIIESDVILRDGIGINILMWLTNRKPGVNLNGTDFIPKLLDGLPRDRKIAIYGTDEPYLGRTLHRLQLMGFSTVLLENGFHNDEYYLAQYMHQLPTFVILAMGMPKQERVSALLKKASGERSVLFVNGGAIVDFMANRYPRAPRWVRSAGLEWGFRLLNEPKRLWKRNVDNFTFILRSILVGITQKFHKY